MRVVLLLFLSFAEALLPYYQRKTGHHLEAEKFDDTPQFETFDPNDPNIIQGRAMKRRKIQFSIFIF